jgi:hypothetical protein
MKAKLITSALALALGLSASGSFADEVHVLTREQVHASVLQAIADGTLRPVNDRGVPQTQPAGSNLTRETVKAEYLATVNSGVHFRALDRDVESTRPDATVATRSREDVRAEAILSAKHRAQDYGG